MSSYIQRKNYFCTLVERRSNTASTDLALSREILLKCPRCRELLYIQDWQRNLKVCPLCEYHFRLSALERIAQLVDPGSFSESAAHLRSLDPLHFVSGSQSYAARLREEEKRAGLREAVVTGRALVGGQPLILAIMDFHFIGGSMGSVVGEKITRSIEMALRDRLPLLIVAASGGARMQEGIFSLMQMAKISTALARLSVARLPFISLLTDPTTGGVAASFALLGDIILAEPGALIGFAGPRVIEQFLHHPLPVDTDTPEFALAHGMIDAIVHRRQLRSTIAQLLGYYAIPPDRTWPPPSLAQEQTALVGETRGETVQSESSQQSMCSRWEQVQLARHKDRPHSEDYLKMLWKDFFELRGDRCYGDDRAIIGGLATIAGHTVMVIGHQKGRESKQRLAVNFGMPHPEGYRKVRRLVEAAEKFRFPVVLLIDTPGAALDLEAEQRGQTRAIAELLNAMATVAVPLISVIIGEGGSGGALALALADRVLMLEHAIYSVASPEAAAAILWHNSAHAAQAAEAMQVSAQDLLMEGVIDGIISEPAGGAHLDHALSARLLMQQLCQTLAQLLDTPIDVLLEQRYTRFRCIGYFSDA